MHIRSTLTLLALLLAAPALAQVPDYRADVEACVTRYPVAWACAHSGRACSADFVILCARDISRTDTRVGVNGKRGNPADLSQDILALRGVGSAVDVTRGNAPMEIIDVIACAGGAATCAPSVAWGVAPGGPGDRGAWVDPFSVQPTAGGTPAPMPPTPTPTPTPQPPAPTVDLAPVLAKLDALAAQVSALQAAQGEQGMSVALTLEAAQRAAHNAEQGALAVLKVENWLDAGLMVELRVPTFGGTARGAATVRRAP